MILSDWVYKTLVGALVNLGVLDRPVDENAETLRDKISAEVTPTLEEIMADEEIADHPVGAGFAHKDAKANA